MSSDLCMIAPLPLKTLLLAGHSRKPARRWKRLSWSLVMVAGWRRGALSAAAALERPVEAPEEVRLLGRVEPVKGYFNLGEFDAQ